MKRQFRSVDPELLTEFERQLVSTLKISGADNHELRDAACRLVEDLKAAGYPIEHVIIEMHEISMRAGASRNSYDWGDPKLTPADALVDRLITLCIERYYQ